MSYKDFEEAYDAIENVFAEETVLYYRWIVLKAIKAAYKREFVKNFSPGLLLDNLKSIKTLINAASVLNLQGWKNTLLINRNTAFDPIFYRGRFTYVSDWGYLPRTLSFKEYRSPHLVFKRFFKFQSLAQWEDDLNLISEYAILDLGIFENYEELNILSVYRHLTKLIEACHLVDVRELTPLRIKGKGD